MQTNSPVNPDPQRCGQCNQFEKSKLDGYGYCKSARDVELRARLLQRDDVCLFLTDWRAA